MGVTGLETYLVEAYLPRTSPGGPDAAAARARAAATQMRREGTPIRVRRSFFLPEDEVWFCLYEARSADEVVEASRRAELVLGRIQRAVDISARVNQMKGARDEAVSDERN
jgi:hypothetical protein